MIEILFLLTCLVLPAALVIGGIFLLVRRSSRAASAATPQSPSLQAFQTQVARWVAAGKLTEAEAAPVLAVIRTEIFGQAPAQPVTAPAPVVPVVAPPVVPVQGAPVAATPVVPPAPAAPPPAPVPSRAERLWSGLLALRARQMLLFLGAFLLVVSSLVLVLYNRERFPPLLQGGLFAVVCAALYGAGEWLERRWALPSAAAGLRAVSGVLWPFVGFVIARLLVGGIHGPWLAASLLSLPLYVLAARRLRQPLFAILGCVAGVNAALAATGYIHWELLPTALMLTLVGYLIVARRLQTFDPNISRSIVWLAQIAAPVGIVVASALRLGGLLGDGALSAALWGLLAFYAVAAWQDDRRVWAWAACLVGPLAALTTASALFPGRPGLAAALVLGLSILYLGAEFGLRVANRNLSRVPGLAARLLGPAAILAAALLDFGGRDAALALWFGLGFSLLVLWANPRIRWSVFAALVLPAALGTTLLAIGNLPARTLETTLLVVAFAYIGLARWLRAGQFALRMGPLLVAHSLAPLVFAVTFVFFKSVWLDAGLLWAVVGFYLLALALERRPWLLYPALLLAPLAWMATSTIWNPTGSQVLAQLSLFVLGYIGYALALEPRRRRFALPGYIVGTVLGLLLTPFIVSSELATVRWALPALLLAGVLLVVGTHEARLTWLSAANRLLAASAALGAAAVLLSCWLWALLELSLPISEWRAVALLPLAALLFAAARWWPGTLRPGYALVLRAVATPLAVLCGMLALGNRDAALVAALLLTATWAFQTALQRHTAWATLALGTAIGAAILALDRFSASEAQWLLAAGGFAALYTLDAARARGSAWRCLVAPGLSFGTLVGATTLIGLLLQRNLGLPITLAQIGFVLAMAALAATHSAIWRQRLLGYVAGPLLAAGVLLTFASELVFPWRPLDADYAYILCGLTLVLVGIGELVRRRALRYAWPYEQLGFALLLFVPVLAGGEPSRGTLVWAFIALALGFATFRYSLRWALLAALLAADVALLFGARWAFPGGSMAGAARLLVAAAWTQGILGLAIRQLRPKLVRPAYAATLLTGVVSLIFAVTSGLFPAVALPTAQVALALAALVALVATIERVKAATWAALGLLALGLASLHVVFDLTPDWSATYGVFEALVLCVIGWGLSQLIKRGSRFARLAIWQEPLDHGVVLIGIGCTALTLAAVGLETNVLAVTISLVLLTLLLTTAAVRRRSVGLAYGAGATLLLAFLSQLFDLGVRQPEWYVLPAGLYLLALADGIRRFQGQRQLARMIESGALLLILGTATTRAVQAEGAQSFLLALALCGEALLALAYGIVRRRQVPFVGGAAAFIFGVIWLAADPVRDTNTWVIIGACGLGLVAIYVLLERRQEQLMQTGKLWIARFSAWE